MSSGANGVSSGGLVYGGANGSDGQAHPVAWTATGQIYDLGSSVQLPGETYGANDSNQIVGYATVADATQRHAYLWTLGQDNTPPTVTCDAAPTFLLNQPNAVVTATVTDGGSGPATSTVTATVSTSTVGSQTATLTGTDEAGNTATAACAYTVTYRFTGFAAPVDDPPIMNLAKAGQKIPVKWQITDYAGVPVSDPTSFVNVTAGSRACVASDPTDAIETYSGNSGLQYLGGGNWQFNWSTPTAYAGSCRVLHLNLADGATSHFAYFQFK